MALTDIQLTYLKAQLTSEREQLVDSEPDSVHSDIDRVDIKTEKAANPDENKRTDAVENAIALEGHVMESIARVDLALARIASKEYGICADCHNDIPYERLQAFPAAARCLGCKSEFEHAS